MNKSIKILLLEDEPNYTDILTMGLQQEGFESEIVEVATKKGFVDQLKGSSFDVIVSDYTLPDINGMEAVQIAAELVPETPIVVFTGTVGEETAIACLKAGAADYVLKQSPTRLVSALLKAVDAAAVKKEQENARRELKENEEKYRELITEIGDGISVTDTRGVLTFVNPALARMLGYERAEQLVGKSFFEFITPTQLNEIAGYFRQAIESGHTRKSATVEIVRPDGTNTLVEVKSVVIKEGVKVVGTRSVLRDITERKRGEEALQASENRFKAQFDGIPLPTYTWQLRGGQFVLVGHNTAADRVTRQGVRKSVGMTAAQMYADRPDILIDFEQCFARKETIHREMLYRFRSSGEEKKIAVNYVFVPPDLVMVHTDDITERKLTENALQESEKKYRELVDNLGEVIYEINSAGEVTFINQAILRVAGYKPKRIVGRNLADLIYQEDRELLLKRLEELTGGKEYISEYRVISKSGEVRWIQTSSKAIMQGAIYVGARGTLVDITERKRGEKALQESEERFRNLVENITDVFYITNSDGKLIYGSPNVFSVSGFALHEVIGKSYVRLVAPVDRRRVVDFYLVQTRLGVLDAACEFRVLRKDGAILWTEQRTRIVRDGAGKVIEYRNVVRNVTDRKLAEEALREKEERFRNLVENITDVFFVFNPDGKITYASPNLHTETGYSPDEMKGKSYVQLVAPVDRRRLVDFYLEQTRLGVEDAACESRALRKDGTILWAELRTRIVRDSAGNVMEYRSVIRNVTERKLAEETTGRMSKALEESEKKYRELVDNLSDVIYEFNPKAEITFVNPSIVRVLGYEQNELVGKNVFELIFPADREILLKRLGELKQGMEFPLEYRVVSKSGDVRWVRTWSKPIKDGEIFLGARGTLVDITERKLAEVALADSESRLRTILQSEPECVKLLGPNGALLDMNPAGLQMIEADSLEQVIGVPIHEIVTPEYRTAFTTLTKRVFSGESGTLQFEIIGLKGTRRWLDTHAVPLRNAEGTITSLLGLTRDITERKQAQDQLKESEKRYRQLVETLQEGIWTIDKDAYTTFVNPHMAHMLGYTASEMQGKHLFSFMDEGGTEIAKRNLKRRKQGKKERHEFELLTKSGRRIFTTMEVAPILDERGKYAGAIAAVADFTGRKGAEEALQKSETRFRTLFEQAGVGVAVIETGTGRFAEINEKYCDILGYSKEEMLWTTFQAVTHPDDLQADLHNMELIRQGAIRTFSLEKRYLHKSGRIVWANLTVSPLWKPGRPIDFHVAVVEDITSSKQAQEIARTYSDRLQALSKQLLEIQESERSMIARELHDEIGQSLTRLKILLEMDKRGKADGAGQNLQEAAELTGSLISRVRDLSLDLRPPMLDDLGLVPAIRSHFLHHTEKLGIETHFIAEPEEMHFSREIEVTCFRVAQEAVTNALRHSKAKSITVQLKKCETSLELLVHDDGEGFDVDKALRQSVEGKSFGLLGMQERVRLVGGILAINSGRGQGSEVQVKFTNVFRVSLQASERHAVK